MGEPIYREAILQGLILACAASGHLRVCTFGYLAAQKDVEALKQLADCVIDRHSPELKDPDQPRLDLIKAVMEQQICLIFDWLRVSFTHRVMNTDNVRFLTKQ